MIDWTPIVIAAVGFVLTFAKVYGDGILEQRAQAGQDVTVLNKALDNALGVVQNAVDADLRAHPLQSDDLHVTAPLAAGIQYAIDHAGDAMTRLGETPESLAEKLLARQGLTKVTTPVTNPAVSSPL